MSQWLIGVIGGVPAIVVIVIFLRLLAKEVMLRREFMRQSERDDEIWYTTGSPMVWHLED